MDQDDEYREDYDAMTDEELREQLDRLQHDLRHHPASKARERWDTLRRAYTVWLRNIRALGGLLAASESNRELQVELIQNVRPDGARRAFFSVLDQMLFNTIASAIALVERTNGLKKDYAESDFAEEFAKRNDDIAADPETKFLRRFRNYLLHVGAAPFATTMKFGAVTDDDWDVRILLSSEALLQRRDEWDAPSRDFIAANPKGIHLRTVVQRYEVRMTELFQWTFDQFELLHGVDVDSANDLVRRANLTMTAGVSDGKGWEARMRHVGENIQAAREGRPQTDFKAGDAVADEAGELAP